MKKVFFITFAAMSVLLFSIAGCDIGINPLVLDSSLRDSIRVDSEAIPAPFEIPFPPTPLTVDTKTLRNVTGKEIEKISFYNLTLLVDNNTTPTNGKISGRLMVNDTLLLRIDTLSPSLFEKERSIFEKIPGFTLNNDGVGIILRSVKYPPSDGIKVQMFLGPSPTPVHFRLWFRVYGQIQAKPK